MNKLRLSCLGLLFLLQAACSTNTQNSDYLRIRLAQDPESLHPLSYGNAYALQILNLLHQSLLTVNLDTETVEPMLAASLPTIQVTDSLSFFSYRIRPEAQWDNGAAITAEDVAFSLKILQGPHLENERWRAQYGFIRDILFSTDSLQSFTLVCQGYTPEMKLMAGDFFVLPAYQLDPDQLLRNIPFRAVKENPESKAVAEAFQAFTRHFQNPAFSRDTALVKGSGPFRLVSWKTGQHLRVAKKQRWWGARVKPVTRALEVKPSGIHFQIIPDDAAAVLALKAKQIDVMENIPLVAFREMKKDASLNEAFNFYTTPSYDLVFLGMNGRQTYLSDAKARQALAHLLNLPQVIESLYGGLATPTVGMVHPKDKRNYHPTLAPVAYDPAKAAALLQQAGWQKTGNGWTKNIQGRPVTLSLRLIHRTGNVEFENMALLLQQSAQQIGIPISIQGLESSQISQKLKEGDFDLYFRTLTGNPFSFNFMALWHTSNSSGNNVTGFGNAETDRLIENIATLENPDQKAAALHELQEKMQEQSNLVFLYFQVNRMAVSDKIQTPIITSLKPGYDVYSFELKK